jgi:hypothetical protein
MVYAAKGTLQIGNGQRLDASVFGDPSEGDLGRSGDRRCCARI